MSHLFTCFVELCWPQYAQTCIPVLIELCCTPSPLWPLFRESFLPCWPVNFERCNARSKVNTSYHMQWGHLLPPLLPPFLSVLTEPTGPEFCEVALGEVTFCRVGSNSDRSCESDEVCTSSCRCWDGETTRESDTEEFDGVYIDDQGESYLVLE